jgi:exosortase
MARQWWVEPASAHGLLLVFVAGLLVYRRRDRLRALPRDPRDLGFAVACAGLMVFAVGTVTGDVFILRASMPLTAAGAIIVLGGVRHLRLLAAPLGLFILAIPLPAVLVTHATMPLQLVASQVAAVVLQACQVEVLRQGNLLMLERVTLEVADACSGLRSLVSLLSLTAVAAAFLSMSARRGLMLMAAAVPIAIVGNGLRVAATGLLSTAMGEAAARGLVHDLTGYAAFIAMCAVIVALLVASKPRPLLAQA